jgi:2-polyprenyl-3-methyl-5-hydroxy-6-metoxy-1,4-benzoquinol methylase
MTAEMGDRKNPSAEYDWVQRVFQRYKEVGRLMPERQEKLYQKIRDEFVAGKVCIDVGCSLGIGANILSHEARYVWGVDINPKNVDFAKKMFKRPNLDFEVIDIENPPTRELAKFEIVTMIETLEHLEQPEVGLQNLKRFFAPSGIGFITIPNQANEEVLVNEQKHNLHLQRYDAGGFYQLMTKHFNSVVMYSADKLDGWGQEVTVDGSSKDYLILAKVEGVK